MISQPVVAHALERINTEINSFASLDDDERAILLNAAHELLILSNERHWDMERATARILALIGAYAVVNPPITATVTPNEHFATARFDAHPPSGETFIVHRGEQTMVLEK